MCPTSAPPNVQTPFAGCLWLQREALNGFLQLLRQNLGPVRCRPYRLDKGLGFVQVASRHPPWHPQGCLMRSLVTGSSALRSAVPAFFEGLLSCGTGQANQMSSRLKLAALVMFHNSFSMQSSFTLPSATPNTLQ